MVTCVQHRLSVQKTRDALLHVLQGAVRIGEESGERVRAGWVPGA